MTRADANAKGPGLGLAGRLLLNIGLVILAGASTVLVAAVLLAPPLFQLHLQNAGVVVDAQVLEHVTRAFEQAVLTALAVGILVAAATALGISWLISRRLAAPIQDAATTARALADGRLDARLEDPRMGSELATLAASINQLADRLDTTEATRRQLTADLAHQLRTPIASLEATIEAIAEGVLPVDDQTVETLTGQSARLRRLIADLEVVSRAQERQLLLSTRPIAVAQLIDTAVASSRDRYRTAEVALTRSVATDTPDLIVDPDRIGEVLTSLLDNALRHTPAGGAVTIRATAGANPRHPRAIIEIRDTGTGFPPEEADKIFQRFHKGPTSTGSGLGLTISRAIVEAHHGTLTA
ncbi:MAG: HAMP domain-containing protein, partial [Propionibacteriaceae bacterium]|nr:HAMP domain-containing protein [Propionibacteriaceae bacterium]